VTPTPRDFTQRFSSRFTRLKLKSQSTVPKKEPKLTAAQYGNFFNKAINNLKNSVGMSILFASISLKAQGGLRL
jgi:hypothetical protein